MPYSGSAARGRARGRARGDVLAERVNAAADLLDEGVRAPQAARELAERFGCSPRQAHRYLQRAGRSGHVPVRDPVVETEFVFDRLQAAELSAAYYILVPERPARSVRAGQEASRTDEQRSDLCPGLLGPAEGAGDDRVPDRGAARARRAPGSGRA